MAMTPCQWTPIERAGQMVGCIGKQRSPVFHPDGTAVVIHGGKDDYTTDPAGNSGDRIACGVISQDPTTVGRTAQ